MSPKPRRRRLVERGGVEAFEIRLVRWIDRNGDLTASVEVTFPEGGHYPDLAEALGVLAIGADLVRQLEEERQ